MPLPSPRDNENREQFIARAMSDRHMKEFPQKQRAAVAYRQWGETPLRDVTKRGKRK